MRLRVTMAELFESMGFASPHSNLWRHLVLRPTDSELAAINATTGLAPEHVRAMTLSRYADIAVGIDSGTGRFTPTTPWGRVHGSRFCPHCLRATGGAWKLQWRLIWTFACLEHRCVLADFCPECGGAQRYRYRIGAQPPRLGRCDNPARDTTTRQLVRCGAVLAEATAVPLAPEHPSLSAQAAIIDVIDSGIGDFGVYNDHPLPAANVLADLRALAQGVLSGVDMNRVEQIVPTDLATAYRDALPAETTRARHRRIPGLKFKEKPPPAVTTAVAVTAAMAILTQADIVSAAEQLVSLHSCVDRRKVQEAVTGSNAKRSGGASPVLWAVYLSALGQRMTPPDQLRCRLGIAFPQRPAENAVRRDRLVRGTPTMLWSTWSLRLCPPSLFQRGARLALSAAVVLVGTNVTVSKAAALLGGRATAPQVVAVLWKLTKTDHWQQIRSALIQLADHLAGHPSPIDYERRRHLDYTGLLPETAWLRIGRYGTRPEGASTARRYLQERLSGLPAFANPLPPVDATASNSLGLFPSRLTPELNSALDEYALRFLAEHGITDEPVHWQPPMELLGGLRLPAADISCVEVPELHRLIRDRQLQPGAAARHLAVSVDAVRLVLEEHPAPRQPRRAPAPSVTVRRAGPAYQKASLALPRPRFVELYEQQQRSLRDIAAMIGVSKHTVTELARDYRIPPRRPQSPRKYTFDRDWLYREHVTKGRPLAELAREHGVSGATMTKNAKMHNIPVRRLGRYTPDALNNDENIPAVLKPALAGQGGWERLQRLAEIAQFGTLRAAAAHLNAHRTTLGHQIALIERDLGKPVLNPADGHRTHELTAFGEEVVAAGAYAGRPRRAVMPTATPASSVGSKGLSAELPVSRPARVTYASTRLGRRVAAELSARRAKLGIRPALSRKADTWPIPM